MKQILPFITIFSVYNTKYSEALNNKAHVETMEALKEEGVPFKELTDVYKEQQEKSILVVGKEHEEAVAKACQLFEQECYLRSYCDRATELVFANGDVRYIGTLTTVTNNEAVLNYDNYSFDNEGNYYVTKN